MMPVWVLFVCVIINLVASHYWYRQWEKAVQERDDALRQLRGLSAALRTKVDTRLGRR